ncbi:MAG: PAS domain S-box protein, partial [Anaerolineae bacterium]|nr:PAS domain S-box protein [Anaerolineae bacterium]
MSNRTFTWIVLGMLTASLLGAALLIDAALDILNGLDSGLLSASSLEGVAMFRHLVETQLLLPTLVLMGFTVFGIVLFLYIRQMHGDALVESQQASASLHVQEGYLRALFDNANALIYIKDLDGRYLRVNHGYERLFNIQSQSIIGKTVFDLFPQPTAEAVAAANRRAIESGKNVVSEHNAALPDGLHTLLVNQFPIRDEAGRIYALGGISTDVTEFRRVEAELRIRDQAMEASTSAILILDAQQPELPAIYVNPAFETITGYSRTEALGKNPRYLHGDDRDQSGLTSLREAVRTGQDCKVLLRNYRKSGEMYWNELSVSPVRDPDGRLTHYVGIQNDVTLRIEAAQELHDNWEFISTMMKLIPEGIYVFDIQHFVNIYNNQAAERLLGYSFNEFHAMGADAVARLLHPDEQARVLDEIQRLGMLKDGETLRSERRLRHKDGQYRRIECHETIIERTADGLPRRILGIASDVTERRRVEEQLRESQAMVERITRLIPDGVFLYNLKQEYLYNNNRFAEMLGYSPEEMEAMGNRLERVAHLAHPDDLTKTIDYGQRMQILADGREAQTTLRMRHKDGSWRWFNFREVVVSRLEDGTPDQVLGLATDINEQRLAEEAARASTQMLERITQTIPDHVYIHDVITQSVLYENETLGKLLGYSADEFAALGSTTNIALTLVHPDDLSFVIQKHLSLGELADSEVCDYSYRLRHKDGSWHWLYVRESVFARSEDGVATQIVGIAQDITARKAAEAEVIESRRLVDQVANLVPECLYILDLFDMNIIYQNDGYARLLGYPVEMLRGGWQIILEIVHPDDAPALADNVARLHQAPAQSIVESEYRVRHSDGQWRWINAREIVLTRDESGLPRLILGSAADVTERKEAVEKLRQREERYRVISEVSSDYAYFHKVNPDGSIESQWITDGFERVLGLEDPLDPETRLNGRSYFEQHVLHPDDRPTREADLQWVLQGETVYSEYRILFGGEIRWLSTHRKPEIDPETGRVSGYYGVVRDITDRKQAEEALRASEDRYRRLFASNPQPMWVYDLETMVFLDVNDAAEQQYGYTRDEFLSMTLRDLRPTEEGKPLIPSVGVYDPPNAWRHRKKDGSLIDVEVAAHDLS